MDNTDPFYIGFPTADRDTEPYRYLLQHARWWAQNRQNKPTNIACEYSKWFAGEYWDRRPEWPSHYGAFRRWEDIVANADERIGQVFESSSGYTGEWRIQEKRPPREGEMYIQVRVPPTSNLPISDRYVVVAFADRDYDDSYIVEQVNETPNDSLIGERFSDGYRGYWRISERRTPVDGEYYIHENGSNNNRHVYVAGPGTLVPGQALADDVYVVVRASE